MGVAFGILCSFTGVQPLGKRIGQDNRWSVGVRAVWVMSEFISFCFFLAELIRLLFASWRPVREVGLLQVILGLCTFLLLPVRMRRRIRGSFHFLFFFFFVFRGVG